MVMMAATIVFSIFLALNMGGSGFSISFTPSYGCGIISRYKAVVLYSLFLLIGAVVVGPRVVDTLTTKLIHQIANPNSGLIILISACVTMLAANLIKIPQSTSFVMVGAFTGAGISLGKINFGKLLQIFIVAILFSLLAFILTYFIIKLLYPTRSINFRIHEKIATNQNILRMFILSTDCYSSFAVGTNNVANVVAPVLISGAALNPLWLLLIFAPFFGLGGLVFGKGTINTVSKDIIPIGEISAGIISFITSSFVIIASILGLPTPYVQFTTFSVLAISAVKDGIKVTAKKMTVKKILLVWIVVPLVTALISFISHKIFIR